MRRAGRFQARVDRRLRAGAVLYGVGARLDERPRRLFQLRGVDETELIAGMDAALPLSNAAPAADKVLISVQWHSDGTEWEYISLPVESGNLCLGEWVADGKKDVSRNHIGWLYDQGNLSGYFTETETDRLSGADSYKGTNDTKIFDLNGNLLTEVTGTSDAVRLAP